MHAEAKDSFQGLALGAALLVLFRWPELLSRLADRPARLTDLLVST